MVHTPFLPPCPSAASTFFPRTSVGSRQVVGRQVPPYRYCGTNTYYLPCPALGGGGFDVWELDVGMGVCVCVWCMCERMCLALPACPSVFFPHGASVPSGTFPVGTFLSPYLLLLPCPYLTSPHIGIPPPPPPPPPPLFPWLETRRCRTPQLQHASLLRRQRFTLL